jgi:murein DD-endopeptidase MepM/ murein hydrolase activator NlpD
MAINTQKLLPASKKTSALAKANVGKIFSSVSIKSKKIDTKKLTGSLAKRDEPGQIVKTLTDIDTRLKLILGEEQNQQKKKKKEKERKDFEKAEEKLEAPKESKKFSLPGLSLPRMSFLDRIKRFLFFTALGWLFTKFQDQLPKLLGIVKTITQVYVVAEDIFKTLLTGLVNFIDIGYQTYDGLRKKVEDIGGKDAVKTFDDFSSHLNKLINGVIIASTFIAGTASKTPKTPAGPTGAGAAGAGGATGIRGPRYRSSGEAAAGRTLQENVSRQALTRERMLAPTGPRGPLDRIGRSIKGAGAQLETGTLFKKGAGFQKALYNAPGKLKGLVPKGAKFGGGRIPIVGPLITFGIRKFVYGESLGKSAAAAVGTGVGQAVGSWLGGIAGGVIGSVIPGIGTLLVGGAGAAIGNVIGGLLGEWIGALLYDFVAGLGNKKNPQLKAAGGSVTRGGKSKGAVTRTTRIARRKPQKIKPQKSQPGKDVGGKKKIEILYPNPKQTSDTERKPNPYKALTETSKKLKEIPFIGALMGAAVDVTLGQKPDPRVYKSIGNGIEYFIQTTANEKVNSSMGELTRAIVGMAGGGTVPSLMNGGQGTGEMINKVLGTLIQTRVNESLQKIRIELGKKSADTEGSEGGGGGGGGDGTGATSISDTKFSAEINEASKISGMNSAQIAAMMKIESGFDPNNTSGSGARGLMQLMPETYRELYNKYGSKYKLENNITNARTNAILGSLYMRDLYNGPANKNLETMVKMYNAGPAGNLSATQPSNHWKKFKDAYSRFKDAETSISKTEGSKYSYGLFVENPSGKKAGNYSQLESHHDYQSSGMFKGNEVRDFTLIGKGGRYIGLEVPSPANGIVEYAGNSGDGYGKKVIIKTSSGEKILLAHFDALNVKTGDAVSEFTTVVGRQGNTGQSRGYHVHIDAPKSVMKRYVDTLASREGKEPPKPVAEKLKPPTQKPTRSVSSGFLQNLNPFNWFQSKPSVPSKPSIPKGGRGTPDALAGGNKQGGGIIGSKGNYSSLSSYPSYSAEGGMMIAIQPVIIEKPISMPSGGNRGVMFPVPVVVGVNNTSMQKLSRG